MTSQREYTMSRATLSRILRQRGLEELICHSPHCDDAIQVGDRVISKESTHRGKKCRNIYHKLCFLTTLF